MDAIDQNKDDVTPCPVCNLNDFILAQHWSSSPPSEDDLSVHFLQKHSVCLSHKILAKSVLDMDISKETFNDVEKIAQDFLLVLKDAKTLKDENCFLRRKLLETEAFCKNMASNLEKCASNVHNAGTRAFSPEEHILNDGSLEKCAINARNAGTGEFNPEPQEQILNDGSLEKCAHDVDYAGTGEFSPDDKLSKCAASKASHGKLEQTFTKVAERNDVDYGKAVDHEAMSGVDHEAMSGVDHGKAMDVVDYGGAMDVVDHGGAMDYGDIHNTGTGGFSPEEQMLSWGCAVNTASQRKGEFNPAEQTSTQVFEQNVVGQGSLDQSVSSGKKQVQTTLTGSSSQVEVAELVGIPVFQNQIPTSQVQVDELVDNSVFQNQIPTSTQQNMEAQSVRGKHQTFMDEQVETPENKEATKIEDSSNGFKSNKKIKGCKTTMTSKELEAKIRAKLKEFTTEINVSAGNLKSHMENAENMKSDTDMSQEELEDMSKSVEEYKNIHLKFKESVALKIQKLNDALKNLTQGKEATDSEFCEFLEEVRYKSREVLISQPRVLKLPEDESDSDSDERSDQPINYDPPSVPRATQVICQKCSKVFKNMKDYKQHKKEHYHSQFFSCKSCPKVFTNAATLLSHQKSHSGGSAVMKCPYCHYTSKYDQILLRHIRSIHTKEKLFSCDSCEQTFSSYMTLDKHIKNHQDKTKKQCEKCNKFHTKKTICNRK